MPINPDRILYDDKYLLAVQKLSGELTVGGKGEMQKLPLFDFVRAEYPGIHPLNRLDFETSGIVVFARTKPILAKVVESGFKGWKKTYRTLVAGLPKTSKGVIGFPLPTRVKGELVPAVTRYKLLKTFERCSYVEAEIEAGKHHQIRRHFAMIGHPLVLDEMHGDKKFNNWFRSKFHYNRFFLHASAVEFPHPEDGKIIKIESPLPLAFEGILKTLKEQD